MKFKIFLFILLSLSLVAFSQSIPADKEEQLQLIKQLSRTIPLELGKVEGTLPQINILIKKGEKVQARAMVEDALQQISQIESNQKILMQIDETADDESLMIEQVQETKRFLVNKANQLKNAISIYISCEAKLFTREYAFLKNEIQGQLADFGCSYVENPEHADWVIYVSASAREYNKMELGNFATYFSYVDLQLSIDKTANGKRVYQNSFSAKGGNNFSFERAAQEAYKELSPQISTIIKEYIFQ